MVRRWQCCGRAGAPGRSPGGLSPRGARGLSSAALRCGGDRGPAPVLPPASAAQSTRLSGVTRGVPIAFSPYLTLGVVALPTDECPLRLRVPNLGWELLVRSCSSPGAARELQPLAQRQSQHRRSNGSLKKAKQTPHFSLKPALKI